MIEVGYYEILKNYEMLSTEVKIQLEDEKEPFWEDAITYTSSGNEDSPFFNEMAFLMVTLDKDGT